MKVDDPDFFYKYDFEEEIKIPSLKQKNFPHLRFNYKYGITQLLNNDGIILDEVKEKNKFKKSLETFSINIIQSVYIDILKLRFDNIIKIYERKYKKLQNVLAELIGFINSFMIIGKIICYRFNKNIFFSEMINQIFEVEILQKKTNERGVIFNKRKNLIIKLNEDGESITNSINDSKIHDRSHRNNIYTREFYGFETNINKMVFIKTHDQIDGIKILDEFEFPNQRNKQNLNSYSKKSKQTETDVQKTNCNLLTGKSNENKDENNLKNKNNIDLFLKNKMENKQRKNIISFSLIDFIKLFFRCKYLKSADFLRKENIFWRLAYKLYDNLDIINYFSMFKELEILKMSSIMENRNFSINFNKNKKFEDVCKPDHLEFPIKNK